MTASLKDAWQARIEREVGGIGGFVAMLTGRRDLADDVAQETFLEAWRHRDRFRDDEDLGRWLRGIARMILLRRQREMKRLIVPFSPEVVERLDDAWSKAVRAAPETPRLDALRACLETLDAAERRWLGARYRDERTLESMADENGRSVDAVKMLFVRLRKRLFDCVERRLGGQRI